jgi:hypothetical protein
MREYIIGLSEPDTWDDLVEELEATGKLSRRAIFRRVRGTRKPMPRSIALYMADCEDPRVTGYPGESGKDEFKKRTDPYREIKRKHLRRIFTPILVRYTRYVKHLHPERTDIMDQFIEKFASRHGLSESELRKILKNG